MLWLFVVVAVVAVVIIGFVVVGSRDQHPGGAGPAGGLRARGGCGLHRRRPARGRGVEDHPRRRAWILQSDVDLLEEATTEGAGEGIRVVGEDQAIARILGAAEAAQRDLSDGDIVAVLEARLRYLDAIGAIGPEVDGPDEPLA